MGNIVTNFVIQLLRCLLSKNFIIAHTKNRLKPALYHCQPLTLNQSATIMRGVPCNLYRVRTDPRYSKYKFQLQFNPQDVSFSKKIKYAELQVISMELELIRDILNSNSNSFILPRNVPLFHGIYKLEVNKCLHLTKNLRMNKIFIQSQSRISFFGLCFNQFQLHLTFKGVFF